eukprot:gene22453-30710_t
MDELHNNATAMRTSSTDEGIDVSNLFSHHFETLEADISDISNKKYETLVYYRYPFAFVRDPLTRFISAVTEIEYRSQKGKKKSNISKYVTSPIGSQERFQEFVNFILLSSGSLKFLRENSNFHINHLVPQVGTIYLGKKVETQRQPLRLFRFEDFDNELKRLSVESGVKEIYALYTKFGKTDLSPHETSKDPLKTTLAAKSFLSYASVDAYNTFYSGSNGTMQRLDIPSGFALSEYQERARAYLVAICRFYITDYICAGYKLPADCQFIMEEVLTSVREFKRREEEIIDSGFLMGILRIFLPTRLLEFLSSFYCYKTPTPECFASFVHGTSSDNTILRDEL